MLRHQSEPKIREIGLWIGEKIEPTTMETLKEGINQAVKRHMSVVLA